MGRWPPRARTPSFQHPGSPAYDAGRTVPELRCEWTLASTSFSRARRSKNNLGALGDLFAVKRVDCRRCGGALFAAGFEAWPLVICGVLKILPPTASVECPQGLRGRGALRELHPRRRGAVRHAGRREPSGQGARSRARPQAVQSRAPAPCHHRSWPLVFERRARRVRPHCQRHRAVVGNARMPERSPSARRPTLRPNGLSIAWAASLKHIQA